MIYFLYILLSLFTLDTGTLNKDETAAFSQEYGDRLDRVYDATVRVSVSGGTGTGTIYKEDDLYYYILTNAHVATASKVGLEFTKNHYPSPRYAGEVVFRVLRSGVDVASVRVAKSSLPAGINLPVIPLATQEQVSKELLLVTSGCQAGERPSIQNTVTTRDTANLIYYLPTSRPGRSGSALISRDGKTIQGLVAWMTDRGASSEGLAMKVDVVRPLLEGAQSTVAYEEFPLNAIEIPLGSGEFVETEVTALKDCPADSCLDENCPWDIEYISTYPAKDDPWRRRFGGPQSPQPHQEAQPQPDKPKAPASPNNPWESPIPQQPQQPQPQPQQPQQPQPQRPRLFDSEREFGRLFEKFDKLEPKIDLLGENLKRRHEEELEESRRRLKLFDRLESLPQDLDGLAERQSGTIIQGLRNLFWSLVQPFVWLWWIAVILGVLFVLNQFMPALLGANWISVILLGLVSFVSYVYREVITTWSGLLQARQSVKKVATKTPRARKTTQKARK